jgi:DNA repair protein RadC
VREKQVYAAIGAGKTNFNIVNEIKLSYSRKGNCERSVSSSVDAIEVFKEHFDSDDWIKGNLSLRCISIR